ncbi:MAG: phage minor capsid protein [Huintestinicola sp.]
MISPAKLDKLPAEVVHLVEKLQEDIISDICRRVTKAKYLTPSAEWQLYKANQLNLSYSDVNRRIARQLKVRERTVQELYTDTVKQALKEDADIYRIAAAMGKLPGNTGTKIDSYFRSASFSRLLSKGLKSCTKQLRNLCSSMAAEANRQLSDAMDLAHLKVISGAYSYNEAIYSAVKELADKGITRVTYPSGRRDNVDVCVRRAVLSSVNKSCCDIQLDLANEVGSRYVEVSAHFGARPSHAEWQGQIYSLVKGDPKYPYFYEATGYGTGDGLGGWNCRHNFFPYFEGIDTPYHSPEFSKNENNEYYALTRKQRAYERAVRDSKRQLAALDGARRAAADPALRAKLESDFARRSVTLKNREARLDSFIRDNDLQRDNSRVRVAGFGKSVSQKAVAATRQSGDLGNLYNQLYNAFHDLKHPISITRLPNGLGKEIIDIISYSPDKIRSLLTQYHVKVCNTNVKGTPHYSTIKKAIRINTKTIRNDVRGKYTVIFHESGHSIDYNLGNPSQSIDFRKTLCNDFANVVKNVGNYLNTTDKSTVYKAISDSLKNDDRNHSVSDIIGGITQNECKGRWGHNTKYWDDSNKLGAEAFAHFFEATARNDNYKLTVIKALFPDSYRMFLSML